MGRRSGFVVLLLIASAVLGYGHWGGTFAPNRRGRTEYGRGEHGRWRSHAPADCARFDLTFTSEYFAPWRAPARKSCLTRMRDGYPVPDPRCTPGGVNPSVTVAVLRSPAWRTGCIRNHETSERKKHKAYGWYGIREPRGNYDKTQVCELDHLVPLELGGADGLGNIWPECGPSHAALQNRYFRIKDRVENYLAYEVKSGKMPLRAAQRGVAVNWPQYVDAANRYCASIGGCD